MKWKNIKFWCWIEIEFPENLGPQDSLTLRPNEDSELLDDLPEWANTLGDDEEETFPGPQCPSSGIIGVPVCLDLLSVSTEFELNAIPTCQVNVAIGRRADDVTKASAIHYYIDDLKLQLPATVWCRAMSGDSSAGEDAVAEDWPEEKFKIFEGYVTGSGFRRTSQGADLPLALTHWLTDLNFSSAVSKQAHPQNAAQFFYQAKFTIDAKMSGGGTLSAFPVMVSPQLAMPYFNTSVIINDFWGGSKIVNGKGQRVPSGLKDWLLSFTRTDRINASQIKNLATGATGELKPAQNWEACRALARFEPDAEWLMNTESGYVLGVPLAMDDLGQLNYFIANTIGQEIGIETLDAYSNVTFWDKLAGQFHANYMFSIVPLVEKALVVPFVPGLSSGDSEDLVHRTIQTSEIDSVDLQAVMPRPLRAVGVVMGRQMEAGGSTSLTRPAQYASFGGWFDKMAIDPINDTDLNPGGVAPGPKDPRYKEGLIMFKDGPRWMSNFVSNYLYTTKSVGTNTGKTINGLDGGVKPDVAEPRIILKDARPVWDLFARSLYIHEVLKNRQGTVTGPVRFDIAPGSSVKIEATEDKFVKHVVFGGIQNSEECNQKYFKFFWGAVLRVSTVIDCQNMKAFTSLWIAHIRDRKENKDPATAIGRHPLWQKCRWAGCVMVQTTGNVFGTPATKLCDED